MKNRIKKSFYLLWGNLRLKYSKYIWLSLGENCLTDNILQRHGLKSFATPFSHGRSNIDYILNLERRNYVGLLDKQNLHYEDLNDKKVVRSTLINSCDNIYHELHMNGFEFTHHDVIKSEEARISIQRKIDRLIKYKGKKNYVFFYHWRINKNMNKEILIEKLNDLVKIYSIQNKKCNIVIFTQNIISKKAERGINYSSFSESLHFFELNTLYKWEGDDDDVLWAKNDDDIIQKMIIQTKKIVVH